MKKLLSSLLVAVFLFSMVSVNFADARSMSRSSSSSFNSSSSSYKSGASSYKPSSSKSSSSSSKTKTIPKKSIKVNKKVVKNKKEEAVKKDSTTTKKSGVNSKSMTKTPAKPVVNNTYHNSSYYNSSSGSFLPYLATAAGAYLLYEALDDDGAPIYIDSETGERVDPDELESLNVKEVDSVPSDTNTDNQDTNEPSNALYIFFVILAGILLAILLIYILRPRKKK